MGTHPQYKTDFGLQVKKARCIAECFKQQPDIYSRIALLAEKLEKGIITIVEFKESLAQISTLFEIALDSVSEPEYEDEIG